MVAELLVWELEAPGKRNESHAPKAQSWFSSCPGQASLAQDLVMESPTGGKGTARLGPGTTALELPLGQAWHAMQAGMARVAHSARQKFESLERGLQDQARRFQADLGNIARRWQEEAEVSQEVISEDRVEASDCSQQDGGLPSANQLCKEGSKEVGKPSHGGECGAQRLVDKKDEEACAQEWPGRTDSETESDLGLVCVVGPVLFQHGPIGSPELLQLGLPRLWTEKLQGPLFVLSLESCHGSGPDPRMWPWQSVGRIGMVLALVIVAQCLVVEDVKRLLRL